MENPRRPPLSIVLATTHAWPEVEACLNRLLPQARAIGAEVIVADGDGGGLPGDIDGVTRVVLPGASVFALRAAAAQVAAGDIVAVTEDHCVVGEDWCESIVAAHRRHPGAGMIGGPVSNGATRRLSDWANFLTTFSLFMPPLVQDRGDRVPPAANVSFKREVLPESLEDGDLEMAIPARLRAEGRIVMVEGVEVAHVQSHGLFGTIAAHFHNGRSTAGLGAYRQDRHARRAYRWLLLRVAPRMGTIVLRDLRRRRTPLRAWLSLPLTGLLIVAHTVGGLIGATWGPGGSPVRLD